MLYATQLVLDDDLDEEMVNKNNELARQKAAKPTRGKGKAKSKQVAFSPANRVPIDPAHVPEADMGISDVSVRDRNHQRHPVADSVSEEDKIAIEEALQSW